MTKKALLCCLLFLTSGLYAQLNPVAIPGNLTSSSSSCLASNCLSVPILASQTAVTVQLAGTWSATVQFEISSDNGATWNSFSGQAIGTTAFASSATANGSWTFNTAGFTTFRARVSSFASGTVAATVTLDAFTPGIAQQLATAGPSGSNPCLNPHANFQSIAFTTSGTSAVQEVALSGTTKIFVCSLSVVGQSGTTPTFSLVTGTGSNCASGQATLIPAFATPANTMIPFANPVAVGPSGAALCYLQTGTTPVTVAAIGFVQQ